MYEFILHSQIPAPRHDQVCNILAGVAAMQPVRYVEQDLVYRPLKPEHAKPKDSQPAQAQKLHYYKLRRDRAAPDTYSLLLQDTPDPGVKDVNVRKVLERPAPPEVLSRFRTGSEWFSLQGQYTTIGGRFVHGNVVIRLYRVYKDARELDMDPVDAQMPDIDNLQILDKSGMYTMEAYTRTEDGASQELRDTAKIELADFAKMLQGAIDLRPVGRLALETTVKGIQP